jgi:hypothetical protein
MSGQGPKIRAVGVAARAAMLNLASTQLGVPVASLSVSKGVISGGGKTTTYGAVMGGKLFNQAFTPNTLQPGVAPAKPIANYTMATKRDMAPRKDIPAKVTGQYTYVHNIRVPGMLHGRVIRPHGQGAYPYNSNVATKVDASSIAHIPGAKVIQVGNFLGVVAPKEYDVIQAASQLKVTYNDNPILSGDGNMWKRYRDPMRQVRSRPGTGRSPVTSRRPSRPPRRPSPVRSRITTRVTCRSARPAVSLTCRRITRRSGATRRTSRTWSSI